LALLFIIRIYSTTVRSPGFQNGLTRQLLFKVELRNRLHEYSKKAFSLQ